MVLCHFLLNYVCSVSKNTYSTSSRDTYRANGKYIDLRASKTHELLCAKAQRDYFAVEIMER